MIIYRLVGFNELWFTYPVEPGQVYLVLNSADLSGAIVQPSPESPPEPRELPTP